MKVKLLGWGVLASSVLSVAFGVSFYVIGSKKTQENKKKPAIVITRAHPLQKRFEDKSSTLELRAGPADYFPVVGTLEKKDNYQIIDSNGEWYRVAPIRNPASAAWTRLNPTLR